MSGADCHQGRSGIAHDRLHVGEVEVDDARLGDQVGDARDTLAKHVIRHLERFRQRRTRIDHVNEALIRNRDQRIDLLAQTVDAVLSRTSPPGAFEIEWLGDDAHRERAGGTRQFGDHRRSAGPGATAHSGGDENHVSIPHQLGEHIRALFRRASADFGPAAGAEAAGDLVADSHRNFGVAVQQRLGIGVDGNELDPGYAGIDHPVDRIAAGAADADHLDAGERRMEIIEVGRIRIHHVAHPDRRVHASRRRIHARRGPMLIPTSRPGSLALSLKIHTRFHPVRRAPVGAPARSFDARVHAGERTQVYQRSVRPSSSAWKGNFTQKVYLPGTLVPTDMRPRR